MLNRLFIYIRSSFIIWKENHSLKTPRIFTPTIGNVRLLSDNFDIEIFYHHKITKLPKNSTKTVRFGKKHTKIGFFERIDGFS